MTLLRAFRVFPFNPASKTDQPGGAFFVPRKQQGQGRHDIPHLDGVLYGAAGNPVSAIAEYIQVFRGQTITQSEIDHPNKNLIRSIVEYELEVSDRILDLDDPQVLLRLDLRPSQVMTHNRNTTRNISEQIHREIAKGFFWPSTLEASWINITLFESRRENSLSLKTTPQRLTIEMPELHEAAKILGVFIG